ncbi:MAG: sodium:solute symporter family protein [Candidatus Sumerlaeia bacterium]|nr:sodium:solute symporter family protein [Candidatus Sumerlaeia bacterium]
MQPASPLVLAAATSDIRVLVIVTLIYVLIIGYLGFYGYKTTHTSTDYLLAGRNIHPWVMALSYGATFISTAAIIGFGGVAAQLGMGLLWLTCLNIFVGIFIAFVLLGKRTRRMGHNLDAHTFPELLGRRFDSRFIHVFAACVVFLLMPLYAAAVLRGGAEFLRATFQIDLVVATFAFALIVATYVVAGGLRGVMFTDALQGSIMFVGMLVLLGITYSKVGGVVEGHRALTELASQVPEGLAGAGMRGWTAMPSFGSPIWYSMVTTIILGVGIGVLAQPQLAVRFMTVRSGRELNRAVLVGGVFILVMTAVPYLVGSVSNVYFMKTQGTLALTGAGGNIDQVIPLYINSAMPSWFVVLFMLTLLSAAMSTISSQFHAMGTAIGRDIYEQGLRRGRVTGAASILVTRVGIIVAFAITLALALWLPAGIIAAATAVFFGTCAAAFLPMFVGGLFCRGVTRAGAQAGMVAGFLAALLWLAFAHANSARRLMICKTLFDRDSLVPFPWSSIDPLVIALPISILTTVAVSLATRRLDDGHLDRCLAGVGKRPTGT